MLPRNISFIWAAIWQHMKPKHFAPGGRGNDCCVVKGPHQILTYSHRVPPHGHNPLCQWSTAPAMLKRNRHFPPRPYRLWGHRGRGVGFYPRALMADSGSQAMGSQRRIGEGPFPAGSTNL